MLIHRLFHPVVVELFQPLGQLEGLFAAVVVEGIEHQRHIGADSFAHGGAGLEVALNAWCAVIGRLQGMQLVGGIAAHLDAPFGKAGIICGGGEAIFQIIAAHGAGIGGHFITCRADQLVDRQTHGAPGQIPEGEVNRGHMFVIERGQVEALALLDRVPNLLSIVGILADHKRLNRTFQRALGHRTKGVTIDAFVGMDCQHGLARFMFGSASGRGVAMPFRVAYGIGEVAEGLHGDVGNFHGLVPPVDWVAGHWAKSHLMVVGEHR